MTPLFGQIIARIARNGPLTVQQFMEEALSNPDHGYYMTRDPLGARGDFITAPEISQVFGELIGLWCASVWQELGAPPSFDWVELGPGRGTLMADTVRATRTVAGFHGAASIHFIESSPVLREKQKISLADAGRTKCHWHGDLSQLSEKPAICIANEFFDALPVRQFQRVAGTWRERLIDLNETKDGLQFTLALVSAKQHFIPEAVRNAPDGNIIETSPPGMRIMHTLADRIARHGGAALIIDYGHTATATGETLQAVQKHGYADVLSDPGEQDLTTHVDFQTMGDIAVAAGAVRSGPIGQGAFLNALGLPVRAQQLAAGAPGLEQRQDIAARIDRLVNPAQMGTLFKVMGLAGPNQPPLPGFF